MGNETAPRDQGFTLLEFRQGEQTYVLEMDVIDRVVALDQPEAESGQIERVAAEEVLGGGGSERERQGLILQRGGSQVMLVVDRVHRIFDIPADRVFEPPRRVRDAEGGSLLRALVERDGELIVWLNYEAL